MALKALRERVCIALLIFSVTRDLAITRVAGSRSLLEGCRARNFDLLLIADGNLPSAEEQKQQMNMFKDIVNLFSSPEESELTRLKVALFSMTSSGPVKHFSFLDYNKTEELKQAMVNTLLANFTVQNKTSWSSSTPRPADNFPFHAFSQSQGGRIDVDRVVVLVLSNYTLEAERESVAASDANISPTYDDGYDAVISQEHSYDSGYHAFISQACDNVYNATILHPVVGDLVRPWNIMRCLPHNNRPVSGVKFDAVSVSVAMELCGELGRLDDQNGTLSSWYYIPYMGHQEFINWYQSVDYCADTGGELASIETQEELDFLRSRVGQLLKGARFQWLHSFTDDYYYVAMSIGLRRDRKTTAARFHWHNGNPLLLSHWLSDYPNGELGQECGRWEFRTIRNQVGTSTVEGFVNKGCGSYISHIALCEVPFKQLQKPQSESIRIASANRDSFTDALNRGEFTVKDEAIVSVSANVQDLQFLRSLINSNAEFQVFSCEPSTEPGSFVPYSYVCDHIPHCKSGRDETICLYRECDPWPQMEFTCDSGQCVPALSRCDLYKDCYDGSDEEACTECRVRRCTDGTCLPGHYFHDGEIDCGGCDLGMTVCYHDETGPISYLSYDPCAFTCNRYECVEQIQLGDGVIDCTGPEGPLDETLGKLEQEDFCLSNDIPTWSPKCVYVKDRYSGVLGCRDMSHLHSCWNFTCQEGYVKCPGSYCIPLHYVLDSNKDCPKGEDEKNMEPTGCKGNFACWGSKVCLHPDLVCDGSPQCPSGDDELDCNVSCAYGFRCIAGTVTVNHDFDKSRPLLSLSFISPLTRYLDLSGVDLSSNFTYETRGQFYHLLELRLSGCKLRDASGEFARDLHRLRTVYMVDVSYNLISEITEHSMFSYMPNLHQLDLSHNKLLTVLPLRGFHSFSEISYLQYLDLSGTAIKHINQMFLQGLTRLNKLNLSSTNIKEISKNTFPVNFVLTTFDLRQVPLADIHPDSVKELTVYSNLYTDTYKLCCPQIRGLGIPEHVCHAPQEAVSSCFDLVRDETQRVLLWLVGILALLGNVVVIVYRVIIGKEVLKRSYGLFIINLSMADLLMGVYLIIIAGTDVRYRGSYVLHEKTWRHSALCQAAGVLSTLSSETSAFFIFLVTVDRFLVIKFPYGGYRFSKVGTAVSCAAAWCVGFVLALIPVLPALSDWRIYSSSGVCLGLPLTSKRPEGWGYSVAVFIFLNFIMFVIIACGQYLIYRAVSENRMTGTAVTQKSARRAQDIMVAKQLSLVALSDFLCWFPIGFMGLLALSGHVISKDAYTWSAVLVLPINSALNPMLYTVPVLLDKWKKFKTGRSTSAGSSSKS